MSRCPSQSAIRLIALLIVLAPGMSVGDVRRVDVGAAYDSLRSRAQAPVPQRVWAWGEGMEFYLCATPALSKLNGSELAFVFTPRNSINTAYLEINPLAPVDGSRDGFSVPLLLNYAASAGGKQSVAAGVGFLELRQFSQDYKQFVSQYPTQLRRKVAPIEGLRPLLLREYDAYAPILADYKNAIFLASTDDLRLSADQYSIGKSFSDSSFHVTVPLPAKQLFVKPEDPPQFYDGPEGWLSDPSHDIEIKLRVPDLAEAESLIASTSRTPGSVEYLFQFASLNFCPSAPFMGLGHYGPVTGLRLLGYRVSLVSGAQEKIYTFMFPGPSVAVATGATGPPR